MNLLFKQDHEPLIRLKTYPVPALKPLTTEKVSFDLARYLMHGMARGLFRVKSTSQGLLSISS